MNRFQSHLRTVLVLLANCYMETVCVDPEQAIMQRHWVIRRYVDYGLLVWC